ncbi:hypothetical protein ACPTJX_15175, partial [Enterococcus faecalis]|uniref:hypothetical protein n=1 Tax=Enterococcus faecalis TaxID=1351 RepID=UPI003CC68FA3
RVMFDLGIFYNIYQPGVLDKLIGRFYFLFVDIVFYIFFGRCLFLFSMVICYDITLKKFVFF